jgi:glutamyl-tRNA reductase
MTMPSSPLHAFHVIGVSHRTAPVSVREQLVLAPGETAAWIEHHRAAGRGAAILSTCNRFEIYWSGDDDLEPWFQQFARERGVELGGSLTRFDGEACVRHLFRVAAGLESQILGETEILGQVRRAHCPAQGATGQDRALDAVFRAAIATGRRIRQETSLGRHPASVSSAAVDVALAAVSEGRSPTVLILGAGEVATGVLRALMEREVPQVTLVNRHPERAARLAARWGVESRPWVELGSLMATTDLLFVATGAKHALVGVTDVAAAGRASDLVVLDLAVPRNVEAGVGDLSRVRLFDLDDLEKLRCPAAGQASIAVAGAERIIEDELARLTASLRGRAAAPGLAELHQLAQQIACEEANRALAGLHRLSDMERDVVRDMAERLVKRVLYPVSRSLREELSA